ncbi:hypothetical protein LCGC14_0268020 [marine sediment metagenome]|uniref:DNA-binding protein n=1 Tax=marine sediment metagenome TaxID=412755 RepID=A0A0F9WKT0_9ZZZZ
MPVEIEKASEFEISEKKMFGQRHSKYLKDGDLIRHFVNTKEYLTEKDLAELLGVTANTAKDRANPFASDKEIYVDIGKEVQPVSIPRLLARRLDKPQGDDQDHFMFAFINHDPAFSDLHIPEDDPEYPFDEVIDKIVGYLNMKRLSPSDVRKLQEVQEEDDDDPMNAPSAEEDTEPEESGEALPASQKRGATKPQKK